MEKTSAITSLWLTTLARCSKISRSRLVSSFCRSGALFQEERSRKLAEIFNGMVFLQVIYRGRLVPEIDKFEEINSSLLVIVHEVEQRGQVDLRNEYFELDQRFPNIFNGNITALGLVHLRPCVFQRIFPLIFKSA